MSTNGVVAVGNLKKWNGVLNYWDSYPTSLGADVYQRVKAQLSSRSLQEIGDKILKAGRWEVCIGEPLTLSGEPREPEIISSEHPDPLRLEWVYILNCEKNAIQVLAHRCFKWVAPPAGSKVSIGSHGIIHDGPKSLRGGRWHYGHCVYGHIHVGDLTFDQQPDFEALEAKASHLGEQLTIHEVFGFEKSSLFKKLLKASGVRFENKATSLGFEPKDLGKTIVVAGDGGSGMEYKILGLEDDRGQSIILGQQKTGYIECLSVDAVLTALGRKSETASVAG